MGGLAGESAEGFEVEIDKTCHDLGGVRNVGGFAAFSSEGIRSEKGAVGFEHELTERGCLERGFDLGCVFEGQDSCETDKATQVEDPLSGCGPVDEAMEHPFGAIEPGG